MTRILLLSKYDRRGASSRLRSFQFQPILERLGFEIETAPLFDEIYLERLYKGGFTGASVLRGYIKRLARMASARRFDLIWLEKELFPWVPVLVEQALLPRSVPLVIDYDDAVFHRYDMHGSVVVRALLRDKIDALMQRADLVVVGNDYLLKRAQQAGARRVECVPTVVDTDRYRSTLAGDKADLVIGWVGTQVTTRYLGLVASALRRAQDELGARVVLIGPTRPATGFSAHLREWSEASEASEICAIDIGIMPLPDEPFERGKCGYKLIQYMACTKPVVASPVGANTRIVEHGVNGFLAGDADQWFDSLRWLAENPAARAEMGRRGREKVERCYSVNAVAPRLGELFKEAAEAGVGRRGSGAERWR